jgi:hypothetical protein
VASEVAKMMGSRLSQRGGLVEVPLPRGGLRRPLILTTVFALAAAVVELEQLRGEM